MKQNDAVALGLSTLVAGGLVFMAYRGRAATPRPAVFPPAPAPTPTPGTDVQFDAARRVIDTALEQLRLSGGGNAAQREQIAVALDNQAAGLEATGQSPAAVRLLRDTAAQLRAGQTPPAPAPAPTPTPTPIPTIPTTALTLEQARAIITATEAAARGLPPEQRTLLAGQLTFAANLPGTDPTARQELLQAAIRLQGGAIGPFATLTATGAAIGALAGRYAELRARCADFLQGVSAIDEATLGAADRTTRDLRAAGDERRAQDLGALASASYVRAGIPRPTAFVA